jgi:hypothetical protein
MMCFEKPGLKKELYIAQNAHVRYIYIYIYIYILDRRTDILITDKPTFSSERMSHEEYYRRSSVEKEMSGCGSQRA